MLLPLDLAAQRANNQNNQLVLPGNWSYVYNRELKRTRRLTQQVGYKAMAVIAR